MKVRYLLAMTVALSVSATAFAADDKVAKEKTAEEKAAEKILELFQDGNCNNCHAVESKTVGPSLISVADKYRDDKEAQSKLEKKVRSGGVGTWGVLPMPGTRQNFSDESIKILVTWILEQKKKPAEEPKTDQKSDTKTDKKTDQKVK
jgi:cytochrome c